MYRIKMVFSLCILSFLVMKLYSCNDDLHQTRSYSKNSLKLVRKLLRDASKEREIFPTKTHTSQLVVAFDLAYHQILELDAKNQVLTSNVWVRQYWNNSRLVWNPDEYGGITSLNLSPQHVWTPDIVLYNNINAGSSGGQMYKFDTKTILHHDGRCEWFAPTEIKSICKIDITFFPFDQQKCPLIFGSWTHTSQFIDLQPKRVAGDLAKYTENGEWSLVSMPSVKNVVKYSCCKYPFVDITYTVHLRRRPLFYITSLILPCILLALLTAFSFTMPPGSGERISLVITIMLGLTVYMMIFTEHIPRTSEVTPLINKFFLTVLVEVAISLIATSLTLYFYHSREDHSPTSKCLSGILSYLATVLNVKNTEGQTKSVKSNKFSRYSRSKNTFAKFKQFPRLPRFYSDDIQLNTSKESMEGKLHFINDSLSDINEQLNSMSLEREKRNKGHFEARVVDRFFLFIFLLTISVSFVVFFMMIPQYIYENVEQAN